MTHCWSNTAVIYAVQLTVLPHVLYTESPFELTFWVVCCCTEKLRASVIKFCICATDETFSALQLEEVNLSMCPACKRMCFDGIWLFRPHRTMTREKQLVSRSAEQRGSFLPGPLFRSCLFFIWNEQIWRGQCWATIHVQVIRAAKCTYNDKTHKQDAIKRRFIRLERIIR